MAVSPADLALEIGVTQARAEQLLMAATALVDRFAPDAPEPIKDEATIRAAGYLVEQPRAAIRSDSVGDIATVFTPSSLSALRHSGAMSLLSPWKVRRAGAI